MKMAQTLAPYLFEPFYNAGEEYVAVTETMGGK